MTASKIDNLYISYDDVEIIKQDEGHFNIVSDLLVRKEGLKVAIIVFNYQTKTVMVVPYLDSGIEGYDYDFIKSLTDDDVQNLINRFESVFTAWYLDLSLSKIHEDNGYIPQDAVVKALPLAKTLEYPITLEHGFNQVCNTPEELVYHWFTDLLEEGLDDEQECQAIREECQSILNLK